MDPPGQAGRAKRRRTGAGVAGWGRRGAQKAAPKRVAMQRAPGIVAPGIASASLMQLITRFFLNWGRLFQLTLRVVSDTTSVGGPRLTPHAKTNHRHHDHQQRRRHHHHDHHHYRQPFWLSPRSSCVFILCPSCCSSYAWEYRRHYSQELKWHKCLELAGHQRNGS